ncbi:hypothetical protein PINS_up010958 [Pythium insidiosum]|nr:hypothetical protein PINS_up010958 [Pythium insidiosum]
MTAGVELHVKSIAIPETNVVVELYLLDCAGQSVFNQREFGALHYRNASIAVVVFDVNNKESFKSSTKWLQDVVGASPNHNIPGVLVANKTDLRENNRDAVSVKDAQELADRLEVKYFECSAQQNVGVEAPFVYIAEWFYKKYQSASSRA